MLFRSVNLKVDSMNLMAKAAEPYTGHVIDIENLATQVNKAYEYEKGRPKNEITVKMWEKLKDPNKDLLGGYFRLWKQKGILSQAFIDEKGIQIGKAFDEIIGLESGKIKKSDITE